MIAGINAPPMHPNCRSTTASYVGNWRDKFFKDRKGKYSLKVDEAADLIDTNVANKSDNNTIKANESKNTNNTNQSCVLNDYNDQYGIKRREYVEKYYNSVRKRDENIEIKAIASNTVIRERTVKRAMNTYLKKFKLIHGFDRFYPDYNMSLSWQRLREGNDIRKMNMLLLKHEAIEHYLMNKYNYSYSQAHRIVERKYNYAQELVNEGLV